MQIIREPRVYIVGRVAANSAEIERFMKEHGLSWSTDTEVGAEALCEVAGRLCYMSFGQGRKTNAEYLRTSSSRSTGRCWSTWLGTC